MFTWVYQTAPVVDGVREVLGREWPATRRLGEWDVARCLLGGPRSEPLGQRTSEWKLTELVCDAIPISALFLLQCEPRGQGTYSPEGDQAAELWTQPWTCMQQLRSAHRGPACIDDCTNSQPGQCYARLGCQACVTDHIELDKVGGHEYSINPRRWGPNKTYATRQQSCSLGLNMCLYVLSFQALTSKAETVGDFMPPTSREDLSLQQEAVSHKFIMQTRPWDLRHAGRKGPRPQSGRIELPSCSSSCILDRASLTRALASSTSYPSCVSSVASRLALA